jgi:hypothetical protein
MLGEFTKVWRWLKLSAVAWRGEGHRQLVLGAQGHLLLRLGRRLLWRLREHLLLW